MSQIKYNLQFLKEKGFFRSPIRRILENREVVLDKENGFVYVEVNNNEEVEKFKRLVREEFKRIRYIWFWFPSANKLKVFRTLGEIKWFWFSPNRERYETRKSKEEKLRKFSKDNVSILFDTRDVVNRFYNELWKIRIEMAKTVKDLKEDGNKLYVVQRFIDRMIFFYFLSQLGLVKIKNEEIDWKLNKENTKRFFNWLIETLHTDEKLLEFMNEIFFEILNKVTIEGWSSKKFKIGEETFLVEAPSLNGGLFREEKFEEKSEREIRFKGIRKLIELLNKYNWVVGEEIPEEDRIGDLTPEIIGHIYEKFVVSLEQMGTNLKKIKLSEMEATREGLKLGRKKIGAYYTPEEITNYISKNTIFPYIKDKLKEKFGEEAVRFFNEIFKKEIKLEEKHKEILKYLYFEILSKIKICDNACGSGSFLIAAGDILLRIYSRVLYLLGKNFAGDKEVKQIINEIRSSPSRSYYIVRKIITTNLYGVDIMEGAIEIAKLRFWLWLISQLDPKKIEDKKIETLPNLDFNLMVGNSLIGFVDIEDVVKGFTIFDFSKRPLEWLKNLAKEKQRYKTLPAHKAVRLKERLNKELKKARRFLNEKFYNMLKSKGIKISWEEFLKLKPFHWGFEFYEVFDLEKPKEERGFDVIIGNPPYGNILSDIEKEIAKKLYPFKVALTEKGLKGSHNAAAIFTERSFSILKYQGRFGYIVPNSILRIPQFIKLRRFIIKNTTFYHVMDAAMPFIGVNLEMVIIFYKKAKTKTYSLSTKSLKTGEMIFIPKEVLERMDYFPIYYDHIFEHIITLPNIKIGILSALQGKPRKADYVKSKIGIRCISAKMIDRYTLDLTKDTHRIVSKNFNYIDNEKDKEILITPYFFGSDLSSLKKDVFEVTLKPKEFIADGNAVLIFTNDLEKKVIMVILNSRLGNFLMKRYILNYSIRDITIRTDSIKHFPVRIPPNHQIFIILGEYMLFLNAKKEIRIKEKELIDFIDRQIIDSLVYELYLKERFYEDKFYERNEYILLKLIESHLKPINYDRWSELHWKKQLEDKLSEKEEKELKELEEKNLKIIKKVVEKIRNDKSVIELIQKIKSHEWVKIIEGKKY